MSRSGSTLKDLGTYDAMTAQSARAAASAARGEAMANLARGIAALLQRLADSARRRSDMRRLSALDDHMLGDMGVSRSGIEYAVRNGRNGPSWEDQLSAMDLRQLADLPMGPEPRYRD